MTTIPGCYCIGEANFSDHGANRLGASALMQGLADGYFVLPYTIGDYLSDDIRTGKISTQTPEFEAAEKDVTDRIAFFINNKGTRSVDYYHREEHQTEDGEAKRIKEFQFVSAWEYKGEPKDAVLHKEELVYENIEVKERSYK